MMKKRILSTLLAFCLLLSLLPTRAAAADTDMVCPPASVVLERMLALKATYPDGTPWTTGVFRTFNGGNDGGKIAENGEACTAFAYMLSNAAFGTLPGKLYSRGEDNFKSFQNLKVGDIIQINNSMGGKHTVIILSVLDDGGVQIAEGNYNDAVLWHRTLSAETVAAADFRITRYPGDIYPDDPAANEPMEDENGEKAEGTIGSLQWKLNKMGTLTISGNGAMDSAPWRTNYSDKINRVVIESGVTSICTDAFRESKVASVTLPETLKIIGERAFQSSTLQSITLPASIEEVKAGAFYSCLNLTTVTFKGTSDNAVIMGDNIFSRCWELKKVTLPKKIDKISNEMFQASPKLTSVNIPDGTASIGGGAFGSCTALTSLYIPVSVEEIGTGAFASCGLQSGTVDYGGTQAQWNTLKTHMYGDTKTALDNATINYGASAPTPGPEEPGPDTPTPGPGPDTPDTPDTPNCSNGHTWDGGAVTSSPSCTSGGTRTYTCTVCGQKKTEGISSLGHNWDKGVITTEPGEETEGVRTYTCSRCRTTKTQAIPATGHVQHRWDDGEVTTEPTCTKEGVLTYTCQKCGEKQTEPIPATGKHEWDEGTLSVSDCAKGGVKAYQCTVCGGTREETVPAGEHTWDNGKVSSGSCTEGGEQTYTCTVCGKIKTDALPADGHTWDEGKITAEPSCTEEGVKTFTCVKCGAAQTEAVPAKGHERDNGMETAPSCTESGKLVYACTACGETLETRMIPAKGHSFTGSDETGYTCQSCGETIDPVLKKPLDAIQDKVETGKVTIVETIENGEAGKTEVTTESEQKVQVLPAATVVNKNDKEAVKAAVETHLKKAIEQIISTVSEAADKVVSKLEEVDTKRGEYDGKPGTWYIYKVSLVRTAARSADELDAAEIWVFVSDEEPVIANPNPDGETYYISIPKTDGGEIIPRTRYAAYGERVILSAYPDKGYELDSVTVKDMRGRALALREISKEQFSFVMPAGKVTAEAVFVKTADKNSGSGAEPVPGTSHTTTDPNDEPFTGLGTPGISGIVLNPAAMPFTDVTANMWCYNGVEYMWKHYLMSGVSDTQFAPGATTSRAMIWTVLARMNNIRTDINPGSTWYEKGMLWAVEKGLTDGTNPMGEITREQLAAMLWRNAGQPGSNGEGLSRFKDADSVSGYAESAVRWAVSVGVLNGNGGMLNPKGTATRAEVAVMIARYGDKTV